MVMFTNQCLKQLFIRLFLTFIILLLMNDLAFAQNTHLPYFNGFETPEDTVGWSFKKRPNTSGFAIGDAVHCLGRKAMYITSDGGTTASYVTTNSGYVSIAYKPFTLPAGTYTLAFDYQLGGDNSQDIKVAWAPASTTLSAASLGVSYPNAISLNQFFGADETSTFGVSVWRHVSGIVTVPAGGGTYNLCFAFRTNSKNVINPGACIDNIQLDTVKSATDCTLVPYNIQVTKNAQSATITWNGNATEYEVMSASISDPHNYDNVRHTAVATNSDTFQYSELDDGHYVFYVRAICGSDTSIYGVSSDILIYDASARCIDFTNFNAPGTKCTIGSCSNPYQTISCVDNGPSQMSSRHTVHNDISETDPRTNGGLRAVPIGEAMSVRLGNWINGAEAESVTYTYTVPTGSNLILIMKYAVVFEDPGVFDSPEFKLEIMDANNQPFDSVCVMVNHVNYGTLTNGWHYCLSPYSTTLSAIVWYKDWTTIGMNLSAYAGQTIKIRLTTYDGNSSYHFGYAYYTLDCLQAEMTGIMSCTDNSTQITAPDGFNYQWVNNSTGQNVSTAQTLPIQEEDTCSYTCICSFKECPTCSFSLTAHAIKRLPESSFTYDMSYSDCQTHITFTNNSQVYELQRGVKTYLPNESISSQSWTVRSNHADRPYHGLILGDLTLSQIDVPKEGDTIDITLTSWVGDCSHDTTITINVLPLEDRNTAENHYVCLNEPIVLDNTGDVYMFISQDSLRITDRYGVLRYITNMHSVHRGETLSTWYGCDSLIGHNLVLMIADTIDIDTMISSKQQYCLHVNDASGQQVLLDTCIYGFGYYDFHVQAVSTSCDSLYYRVNVHPIDTGYSVYVSGFYWYVAGDVYSNGHNGCVQGIGVYNLGDTVTLTAIPYEHYHFAGWSDGCDSATRTIVVSGDTILNVSFEIDQHTVTALAQNGTVTGTGTYDYWTYVLLTAIPDNHYHFVSWSDGNTSASRYIILESDTSFTAIFEEDTKYELIVSVKDSLMGTTDGSDFYYYNDNAIITAYPNEGYEFLMWTDGNTVNPRVVQVVSDSQFVAMFSPEMCNLTVVSADESQGYATGGGSYLYGSEVTIRAIPKPGYEFDRWDDDNTDNPRNVIVTVGGFYMAIFKSETGLSDVTYNNKNVTVEKVMINGVVYVLRNGVLYTITGVRVK